MAKCPHAKKECPHYKPKVKEKSPSPLPEFWEFYIKEYVLAFNGILPDDCMNYPRDTKIMNKLLRTHTMDDLKSLVPKYFKTKHAFFLHNAYDIPRFEKFVASAAIGGHQDDKPKLFSERNAEKRTQNWDEIRSRLGVHQGSDGMASGLSQGERNGRGAGKVYDSPLEAPEMETDEIGRISANIRKIPG